MHSQSLYSHLAYGYDTITRLNGYERAVRKVLTELPIKPTDSISILDAGCGTGLYTKALRERFVNARIVAFDLNPEMVEVLRLSLAKQGSAARTDLFVSNVMDDIPYPEPSFDLIVTGGVLEYVDITAAIRHLSRYLVPGGLFLDSPVRDNYLGHVIGKSAGFRPYTTEIHHTAFAQNGFQLEKKIMIPPVLPISWVKDEYLFRKKM